MPAIYPVKRDPDNHVCQAARGNKEYLTGGVILR